MSNRKKSALERRWQARRNAWRTKDHQTATVGAFDSFGVWKKGPRIAHPHASHWSAQKRRGRAEERRAAKHDAA